MAATRIVQTNKPSGPVEAQIPPENIPVSAGGPWRRFFEALWRRLGGFQDDVYNGFVDAAGLQARIYQLEQAVTDANYEAAAARQLVSAILADRREIEELRAQVASAQQQASTLSQKLVQVEEERAKDQQQSSFQSQSLLQTAANTKYDLDHKVAAIVDGDAGLTTDAVSEGLTNQYFTDARARAALTATANDWTAAQSLEGAGLNWQLDYHADDDNGFLYQNVARAVCLTRNMRHTSGGVNYATQTDGSRFAITNTTLVWGYFSGASVGTAPSITPAFSFASTGLDLLAGNYLVSGTQVLTSRRTGWGAPTGTATRTTFDTATVTLPQLAEHVKALIDDATTHGLIGT